MAETLPEAMAVLALLSRQVREIEKRLVIMSKGNSDALEAHQAAMDALIRYLQNHGAVTAQLIQDLTIVKARMDQSRIQHSAYVERVMGERRLAAITHLRTQAEATTQQLREQEQRFRQLIQQTAEIQEFHSSVVRYA
jgi:hypothetical protein